MKIGSVVEYLLNNYPLEYASDFDSGKLGLVLGSKNIELTNVLLTLDLNSDVVDDAINKNCNLIIAHHPYFFHPISKINYDSEQGLTIKKMMMNNISLYCMHTNFDVLDGGVNDTLTRILELDDVKIINSIVGKDNFLRYGNLKEKMPLSQLINYVEEKFNLPVIRYVGRLDKIINTVGIVGGGGGSERDTLIASNYCDCYISGEFRLSSGQIAKSVGLTLIEVNHGVEKLSMISLKEELKKYFDCEINITDVNTDPFNTLNNVIIKEKRID